MQRARRRGRGVAAASAAGVLLSIGSICSPTPTQAAEEPVFNDPVDLTPGAEHVESWRVSADGEWIVWHDTAASGQVLWSQRTDGTGEPIRLSPAALHPNGNVAAWHLTPDGARVVFRTDQAADELYSWWSVPTALGESEVEKVSNNGLFDEFGPSAVSPDSSRFVYVQRNAGSDGSNLFSAGADGAGNPVALHTLLPAGRDVSEFVIAPDSSRVAFTGDLEVADEIEVFSTPLAGPATEMDKLVNLIGVQDASSPRISPDSERVVYQRANAAGTTALISVPLDDGVNDEIMSTAGGACCVELGPIAAGSAGPDRVVYRVSGAAALSGDQEFWSAPADDSAAPARINDDNPHDQGASVPVAVGDRVVYFSEEDVDGTFGIFSGALDGTPGSIPISDPLLAGEAVWPTGPIALGGDRSLMGYYIALAAAKVAFVVGPADGSDDNQRVDAPTGMRHIDDAPRLTPDGDAVVWAATNPIGTDAALFMTPLTGGAAQPVELHDPAAGVSDIEVVATDDGYDVLYAVGSLASGGAHVWSVRVDLPQPEVPGGPGDPGGPGGPATPEPDVIVAVPPARLWDTRMEPTVDGLFEGTGPVLAKGTTAITIAGRGGIPADAIGVVANLTVIAPDDPGHATMFPCDGAPPKASNLNYVAGDVFAANGYVALDEQGRLCVASHATANFALDVNGYARADSPVELTAPARFLETRQEAGATTFDGQYQGGGRVAADSVTEVQIAGRGSVPADAHTAFLTVTAVAPEADGYLTVFPCKDRPHASTVNYGPGQTVPNGVVAELSDTGSVCVYSKVATNLIVDVGGSLSADTDRLVTATPERLVDTRPAGPTIDGANSGNPGRLAAGQTVEIQIAGRGSVPADAAAALMNVGIVNPDAPTFATLYPCGDRPVTSNVNLATRGANRANNTLTQLSPTGTVCLYVKGTSDVILDANGWTLTDG